MGQAVNSFPWESKKTAEPVAVENKAPQKVTGKYVESFPWEEGVKTGVSVINAPAAAAIDIATAPEQGVAGSKSLFGILMKNLSRFGRATSTPMYRALEKQQKGTYLKPSELWDAGVEGLFLGPESKTFEDVIKKQLEIGDPAGKALENTARIGFAERAIQKEYEKSGFDLPKLIEAGKRGLMLEEKIPIGKGITGLTEAISSDPLGTPYYIGNPKTKLGQKVSGFSGSLATDPLTYLPVVAEAKAVKEIIPALKTTKAGKYVTEAADALIKSEPVQALGSMFVEDFPLKTKFPEIAKEAERVKNLLGYETNKAIDQGRRLMKLVPDIKERTKIFDALENPIEAEGLSDVGKKVMGYLDKVREGNKQGYLQRELLPEERLIDFYMKHVFPDNKKLGLNIKSLLGEVRASSLKGRTIRAIEGPNGERLVVSIKGGKVRSLEGDMPYIKGNINKDTFIDNFGKEWKMKQATAKEIETSTGIKFERDAAPVHAIKQSEIKRQFTVHDYLTKIANNPEISKILPKGMKPEEGFATVNHPAFEGKQVPKEVADSLLNFIYSSTDKGKALLQKLIDVPQNWWKGQVLIAPSYHTRNQLGNMWNNFLAGVYNPEDYANAAMIQRAAQKGQKALRGVYVILAGKRYRGDQIMDMANQGDLFRHGLYGEDITTAVKEAVKGKGMRRFFPSQLNREVGTVIEDNAKLAHVIGRMRKGDTAQQAIESARKFLFDYTALSPTERDIFKRVFPFYTWTRKNIPLQLEMIVKKPQKYAQLNHLFESIAVPMKPKEEQPQWMAEKSAIKVGDRGPKSSAIIPEGSLPAADINKLASGSSLWESATPLLKMPIENYMNYSGYFRKKIAETPADVTPYFRPDIKVGGVPMGFYAPKQWVGYNLDMLRLPRELSNLFQGAEQPTKDLTKFLSGVKTYEYDKEEVKIQNRLKDMHNIYDLLSKITSLGRQRNKAETGFQKASFDQQIAIAIEMAKKLAKETRNK